MPELEWHLGYFMVWFVMAIVAALMVFYLGARDGCERGFDKIIEIFRMYGLIGLFNLEDRVDWQKDRP